MMMQVSLHQEILVNRISCRWFLSAACVAGIALGAFVRIPLPFTPVPVTLQTLFVLLTGAFLNKRMSGVSIGAYLALGMAGVPVFTGAAAGLAYLGGPTAGYLLGFIPAVFVVSRYLSGRRAGIARTFTVFTVAAAIILGCGAVWLKLVLGLSVTQMLGAGVLPFIPGEIAKITVAALIYRSAASRMDEALGA